jgi:hypothetical protein
MQLLLRPAPRRDCRDVFVAGKDRTTAMRRVGSSLGAACARAAAGPAVAPQRRRETTHADYHTYEPGPVATRLRALFRRFSSAERRKLLAARLAAGLARVERLEGEQRWLRTHGSPLTVLGLPEHADMEDVRLRYKDLLFETHPDTARAVAARHAARLASSAAETPEEAEARAAAAAAGTDATAKVPAALAALPEEQARKHQQESFELLLAANKMIADPGSVWHLNGAAPHILAEIQPRNTLLLRLSNPVTAFGAATVALGFAALAFFAVVVAPLLWLGALRAFDPEFYDFMMQQEAEEARLRAMGIEPDTDPRRLAPLQMKTMFYPGRLVHGADEELEDAL